MSYDGNRALRFNISVKLGVLEHQVGTLTEILLGLSAGGYSADKIDKLFAANKDMEIATSALARVINSLKS